MIRQAEAPDLGSIVRIRESVTIDMVRLEDPIYRVDTQRNGFLLPSGPTVEELEGGELSKYSVSERQGSILGYFSVHGDQGMTPERKVAWFKPNLEEIYFSNPHARLAGISVAPDSRQKGVATEMLQAAERQTLAQGIHWLFAFIVLTPVTNVASMMFHEKNGFERAAVPQPYQFVAKNGFTISGYQFMLYGKQLSD